MIFLQAAGMVKESTNVILNTGVVGAILILALIAIYAMARSFSKQLSDVTNRMNKYIDEDRKQMIDVITRNAIAFEHVSESIEDIRKEFHNNKN